jgi:hypothetical protein
MQSQIRNVYWGETFNAEQEKATGTTGAVFKGGQGEYQGYDKSKCQFIANSEQARLPWGISWQMDARYSPEKHKAALKSFYDRHGFGSLGLWLACELPFYPMPEKLYKLFPFGYYKPIESVWHGMIDYVHEVPGIYVSISKWNLIFGKCPVPVQEQFAKLSNLWVAQYKVSKPDKIGQWSNWYWWQYQENPDYSVTQEIAPAPPGAPADNGDTSGDVRIAVLDEAIKAIEAIK